MNPPRPFPCPREPPSPPRPALFCEDLILADSAGHGAADADATGRTDVVAVLRAVWCGAQLPPGPSSAGQRAARPSEFAAR